MLDVAVAYNRYRFLGNEFLTWFWYAVDNEPALFHRLMNETVVIEIGNRMVLENRFNDKVETVTIKGDEAGLEEALLALQKGGLVTELNLVFRLGEHQWQFNLKGESLNISALKTPETASAETAEDTEGRVLEKIYLYEKVLSLVDKSFSEFARLRTRSEWEQKWHPKLIQWIAAGLQRRPAGGFNAGS